MAYDKAVDSAVLDAGLTAIADAIREKGGTSDPIAFDAMANAIAAIEAGGGGGFASGYFTVVDDITSDVVITHGLGVKPYFFIVVAANNSGGVYTSGSPNHMPFFYAIQYSTSSGYMYGMKYQATKSSVSSYKTDLVSGSHNSTTGSYYRIGISESDIVLRQNKISGQYGLGSGATFYWIAIAEGTIQ